MFARQGAGVMKTHLLPSSSTAAICIAVASLSLCNSLSARELGRDRLDTASEIFLWADVNQNNNINSEERDRLRLAFQVRSDFQILDLNQNGRLDREEIDMLEKGRVKQDGNKNKKKKNKKGDGRKNK